MATNPIGKGTKNVTVNVPKELSDQLEELAKRTGVTRNQYLAGILNEAAQAGALVHIRTEVVKTITTPRAAALNETDRIPSSKQAKKVS